ncbi:matrix Gla protein-like, partial [Arapaima gigas]
PTDRMKAALQCVTLSVILTLCLCYGTTSLSYISFKIPLHHKEDVFLNENRANHFLENQGRTPSQNNQYGNFRYGRVVKTQAERQAEVCEDYRPCRYYAYRYGIKQAYEKYFSNQNSQNTQK